MSSPKRTVLTGLVILGVLASGWYALDHLLWGDVDYSNVPRNRLFRSIFGMDIPAGVSDLRIAGRTGPLGLKSWLWMRFGYVDEELPRLLEGRLEYPEQRGREFLTLPDMPMRHVEEDRHVVGWEEIASIQRPEFYEAAGGYPGSAFVWYGTLVLDRKRKLIFVQVIGD